MTTPTMPFPAATATTGYYGVPLLKKPVWTWEVPAYFFVGGAAGAASVIAAVADSIGTDGHLARDARWIAAGGSVVSAALLTSDLGRPERFVNMLRVFKLQSPMSVGSWTLAAFSATATSAAAGFSLARRDHAGPITALARASGATAAALGTVMTTYTGVLIGATAIPVWNEHVRLLPIHFCASGVASAVALLELAGHDDPALNDIALAAAAVETVIGAAIERRVDPVVAPLREGSSGWLIRAGGVLSGPVPIALRTLGRGSPGLRRLAAVSALAGSLLTRLGWLAAGRASADDPVLPLQP